MILINESVELSKNKAISQMIKDIKSVGADKTESSGYFEYVVSNDGEVKEYWSVEVRYDPKGGVGKRYQTKFSVSDRYSHNKPVRYDWTFWGGRYNEMWTVDLKRFLEREVGKSFDD